MNDNLQTETVRISPRRIFQCKTEKRMTTRQDVWKDHNGKYHCKTCGNEVVDVTDTETGKDFMEILCL